MESDWQTRPQRAKRLYPSWLDPREHGIPWARLQLLARSGEGAPVEDALPAWAQARTVALLDARSGATTDPRLQESVEREDYA
jgi:hypothetical protein